MTAEQELLITTPAENTEQAVDLLGMLGIGLLGATIAIHTTELSGKIGETSYLGAGYVLLIAASIVSITLIAQRDRRGWTFGLLTCAATLVGFVLTRTVGLPAATGDIGNWTETIAVWSLVVEVGFVALALVALSGSRSGHRGLRHS